MWKCKRPRIAKTLFKKNKIGGLTVCGYRTPQSRLTAAGIRVDTLMNEIELRTELYAHYGHLILAPWFGGRREWNGLQHMGLGQNPHAKE